MTYFYKTDSLRRALIAGIAALTLAACGGGDTGSSSSSSAASGDNSQYLVENDHVTGSPDAPVTVVEYASVSCGGCAAWHQTVYPEFKKKYVDTNWSNNYHIRVLYLFPV